MTSPYHVQFQNAGPLVVVRNTFLDCDEAPPPNVPLRRGKTAPAQLRSCSSCSCSTRSNSQHADSDADSAAGEHPAEELPKFTQDKTPAPTSPTSLIREDTYDSFEEGNGNDNVSRNVSGAVLNEPLPVMTPVMMSVMIPPSYTQWSQADEEHRMQQLLIQQQIQNHLQLQQQYEMLNQAKKCTEVEQASLQAAAIRAAMMGSIPDSCAPQGAPDHQVAPQKQPWSQGHIATELAQQALIRRSPQTLTQSSNFTYWTVDARKLKASDRVAVSPPFVLYCGRPVTFKMMLSPSITLQGKGGSSFRKSRGWGIIQLKCEAQVSKEDETFPLKFNLSIGSGIGAGTRWEQARGPIENDFVKLGICGLQKHEEEWDFNSVVDEVSETFVVCLDVVPVIQQRYY